MDSTIVDSYLDKHIISASDFNSILRIDDPHSTIPNEQLRDIGRLFVEHKLEHELCVGLLHRHFDLQDG